MNLVGYVRVSTDKQDIGPEVQKEGIKKYCDLYGHTLRCIYVDHASGASMKGRKNLIKAIEEAKRKAHGIIVYKLDRLTRSIADFNKILEDTKDIKLVSVQDQMDTSTASGRVVINILMAISQWERETIGERTRDALAAMRRDGRRTGTVRFGYEAPSTADAALVPCERERGAVRLLRVLQRDLPHGAYSLEDYSRHLSDKGFDSRTGAPYTRKSIASMLATKFDWE